MLKIDISNIEKYIPYIIGGCVLLLIIILLIVLTKKKKKVPPKLESGPIQDLNKYAHNNSEEENKNC